MVVAATELEAVVAAPVGAQGDPATATIVIDGGGYGHGVGMSQYGARGRAEAGLDAAAILGAYYPGAPIVSRSLGSPRVKIGAASQTTLSHAGGVLAGSLGGASAFPVASGAETVTVAANDQSVVVFGPGGIVSGTADQYVAITFSQGVNVSVSAAGRRYKWGRLVFRANGGSLEIVLDSMTMDQYLRGLGEMPGSWPSEALRAQAIAARSFAAHRLAHPRTATYDLVATVFDQAYNGSDQENGTSGERWVAAVTDTTDRVLTYGGNIVQAFYSSSNGGASESSGYVFATSLPYYVVADDIFDQIVTNPQRRWTRAYTGSEVRTWLAAAGRGDAGDVTSVSVGGDVGASGRVDRATVTVTATSGTLTMTGNQFRAAINAGAPASRDLLSTRFSVSSTSPPPPPVEHQPGGVHEGAGFLGDQILVGGWVIDDDDPTAPLQVHVYVDGALVGAALANTPRAEVAAFAPRFGPDHGYFALVPSPVPANVNAASVCVFAIDIGSGPNPLIGCTTIYRTPPRPAAPVVKKRSRRRRVRRR